MLSSHKRKAAALAGLVCAVLLVIPAGLAGAGKLRTNEDSGVLRPAVAPKAHSTNEHMLKLEGRIHPRSSGAAASTRTNDP